MAKKNTVAKYVYTERFAVYSRGKRKAGEEASSAYVDFTDPEVIKRWLKKGFIRLKR